MKALQLVQAGDLRLVDLPQPEPGPGELLVKTGAATICTSDLYDVKSNPFGIALPVVMGHEGAGAVAAVGAGVHGFEAGDRIAAHPVWPCGDCEPCREGLAHLCANMKHFGLNVPGVFAEYFVVRADRARKVPAHVAFTTAALAEPTCCCLESLAQARLRPGQSLLILGDGPFGVLKSRLAGAMDLGRVVIAGYHDFRLSLARSAIRVNTSQFSDAVGELMALTDGKGYDAVILATDNMQAVQQGMACLKRRGRLVVFATYHGATPVELFQVQMRELDIVGAVNDENRLDDAILALSDERLALGELVTHSFPLGDFREAFDLAEHGLSRALKIAFCW